MSATGKRGIGIPILLLHEGQGLTLTVETKSGHLYRGYLQDSEDNFNLQMRNVKVTDPKGDEQQLKNVYIRGSNITFIIFPDMIKNSPMFARVEMAKHGKYLSGGAGMGRGKAVAIRAKAAQRAVLSTFTKR